jgi:hypothetical protein
LFLLDNVPFFYFQQTKPLPFRLSRSAYFLLFTFIPRMFPGFVKPLLLYFAAQFLLALGRSGCCSRFLSAQA